MKKRLMSILLASAMICTLPAFTVTTIQAADVSIKASPDKYTWYLQNYVGSNLASVGYTSLGGDRMAEYGAGYIELCIITEDGSYIDISDTEALKQYVVAGQSLEPNTEIKYTFEKDSEGEEYSNLIAWQNIESIDLLVKPVGTELSADAPELVAITPSPDRYTTYVRNYVGKNAAMFGYNSLSGKRMDEYGAGYLELNLVADDGTYIDASDTELLSLYVVTSQSIAPNTAITYTFLTDSSGEEYDNLIDNQNYELITLNVTKTAASANSARTQAENGTSTDSAGTQAGNGTSTDSVGTQTGNGTSTDSVGTQTGNGTSTDSAGTQTGNGTSTDSTGSQAGSVSSTDSAGAQPSADFKTTMDTYEAFFNEYVDFMTNYDSGDMSQLSEYLELLTTFSEYMQALSGYNDQNLSSEDYAYFLEVYQRILAKLTSVL